MKITLTLLRLIPRTRAEGSCRGERAWTAMAIVMGATVVACALAACSPGALAEPAPAPASSAASHPPSGIQASGAHASVTGTPGAEAPAIEAPRTEGPCAETPRTIGDGCVSEVSAEKVGGELACVFSGSVGAAALRDDLCRIYTTPVEVDPADVALLTFAAGTVMLVDRELYDEINSSPRDPALDRWGDFITDLGTGVATLGVSGLVGLRDKETGYLAANAVIYSGLGCAVLKAALGRARPGLGEGPYDFSGPCVREGHDSMPSGHSAAVFALATVLARQYPKYRVLFYAGAALVAVSRVYERAHWPSDTVVGAAIGVWSANQVMGRSRLFEVTW